MATDGAQVETNAFLANIGACLHVCVRESACLRSLLGLLAIEKNSICLNAFSKHSEILHLHYFSSDVSVTSQRA